MGRIETITFGGVTMKIEILGDALWRAAEELAEVVVKLLLIASGTVFTILVLLKIATR